MKRFLIAEDSSLMKGLYMTIINHAYEKAHIDFACNGFDALKMALTNSYSVIIADIAMPVMNGIELYRALKEQAHPLMKKIIFVSGFIEHEATFFDSEGCSYLHKPFLNSELTDMIDAVIES